MSPGVTDIRKAQLSISSTAGAFAFFSRNALQRFVVGGWLVAGGLVKASRSKEREWPRAEVAGVVVFFPTLPVYRGIMDDEEWEGWSSSTKPSLVVRPVVRWPWHGDQWA